jgi:hypothetical protein
LNFQRRDYLAKWRHKAASTSNRDTTCAQLGLNVFSEAATLADVNLNQPLSQAEVQELTDFLAADSVPFDAMDIGMLDGYLTAIVIGPEFVR